MAVGLFELARVVKIAEAAGVAEAGVGDEATITWLLVGFACAADACFKWVSIEKRADCFVLPLLGLEVAMVGVWGALMLCMLTD
jgi:hypothetical protein